MSDDVVPTYVIVSKEGYDILVDMEDYITYNNFEWHISKDGYPCTTINRHELQLHRLIMGAEDTKFLVDHIDTNRLNCTRHNLRLATSRQNSQNRSKVWDTKFPWKGVQKLNGKRRKPYNARIMLDGQSISLGVYTTPEEAARAYDRKAIEIFGEFANLNFPEG